MSQLAGPESLRQTFEGSALHALLRADLTEKVHRYGADRVVDPATTLARVAPIMKPCGITRVANVTGLDIVGVPVVSVTRPNTRSVAVAQGKGITLEAAKASGIMEAIEAHHAETPHLPLYRGSVADLCARARLADVSALPKTSIVHFGRDTPILWTSAQDLAGEGSVLVPFDLVHTDYTLPFPPGSGCFLLSSNGLASGNHILEAVNHGICELIERDAVTLHAFATPDERRRRRVKLDTVDDELCGEVLERFARAGLAVAVHDVTSDVGVPAFRCDVADDSDGALRSMPPLRGTGCHPRRETALLRALTEAAQTRVTMISGARDDLSPWWYSDRDRVVQARQTFREEQRRTPTRDFHAAPHFDSGTVAGDSNWLIAQLGAAGLASVLVVDLTKPELALPVARVIIPGLEPMQEAPGYVPGERGRRQLARSGA